VGFVTCKKMPSPIMDTPSHGVDNALGKKCTCYSKYGFSTYFMYDGAVSHLDLQPIIPLTSEIEMKSDLNALVMMKKDKTYRELFKASLMTVPFY
jgi:cytochrome c peroxidase